MLCRHPAIRHETKGGGFQRSTPGGPTGEPEFPVVSAAGDDGRRVGTDRLPPGAGPAAAGVVPDHRRRGHRPARAGVRGLRDIELLAGLGLGFLFLLAGHELDPQLLREKAGRQALVAWAISAVLAVLVVGGLQALGFVHAFVPVAIALTTTALGTLLPILREQNMLTGTFGRFVFAAGAVGELFPILAISLFLGAYKTWWEALIIASIAGLAFVLAVADPTARPEPAWRRSSRKTSTPPRSRRCGSPWSCWSVCCSSPRSSESRPRWVRSSRAWSCDESRRRRTTVEFEEKLDAVGYGFFIPVFFVSFRHGPRRAVRRGESGPAAGFLPAAARGARRAGAAGLPEDPSAQGADRDGVPDRNGAATARRAVGDRGQIPG